MKPGSAWPQMMGDLAPVQTLVHLAYRMDAVSASDLRAKMLRRLRDIYESEITIQAALIGCRGQRGNVGAGPVLSQLNSMAETAANGIVNTFNRDLVYALQSIKADIPRANRHIYANHLGRWEQKRSEWKEPQIALSIEGNARSLAQQHFHQFNGSYGSATLTPKRAVCPVCQGWVNRGEVSMSVALNNPPPYHPSCLPSGSMVRMADGTKKPIEIVVAGDRVASRGPDGICRVVQAFCRHAKEPLYRIFIGERILQVTGDHPIQTENGWESAKTLRGGVNTLVVKVAEGNPTIFYYAQVYRIEVDDDFTGDVYNIETESEEFVAEDVVVHNCPHLWDIKPEKVPADQCPELWVG